MKFTIEEVQAMKKQIEEENKHCLTPMQILDLLSKVTVLEHQNIDLMNELGNMIHRVEHYRWWCDHICNLYESQKKEWNERHKETHIETVDGKFFPVTQKGLQQAINHVSELEG